MADITKANEQAAAWERNLEGLQNGMFGEIATYDEATTNQTMLRYWQAQARAGYPYASENVKYFEKMVRNDVCKPFVVKDLYKLVEAVEVAVPHPPYYFFARNKDELKAALYFYGDCSNIYIIDSKRNMYYRGKKVGKFDEGNKQDTKHS